MRLIVGLGNPGKEYENTRHNLGFMAIDEIAKFYGSTTWKEKMNGLYQSITIHNEKVLLLKPQKYMNLSGEVISAFVSFFHIDIDCILIIVDDMDLPCGSLKLKLKGSSGGHNGLKNIELHLHTQEYKRVKIGISHDRHIDTKDYVLGTLNKNDSELVLPLIKRMPSLIDDYLSMPFEKVMSKYNQSIPRGEQS